MPLRHAHDGLFCVVFTTALTAGLTQCSLLAWPLVAWAIHDRAARNAILERPPKGWFEAAKLLGALLGLLAMNLCQLEREYSERSHRVTCHLLALNILMAVASEAQRGLRCLPNALVGVFLVARIPWQPSFPMGDLAAVAEQTGLFYFPLPRHYVLLYTLWNFTFSYGLGYNWSARLILLPPILVCCMHGNLFLWLGARCVSLLLNMVLRETRTSAFYVDGATFVSQRAPEAYYSLLSVVSCSAAFIASGAAGGGGYS